MQQTPIENSLQFYEENSIVFSNLSLLKQGKILNIAMQHMTESQKQFN